jgi:hypothetical protein
MEEVVCPRCGAVFFLSAGTPLCPHCSLNVASRWKRIMVQARRNAWQVILGLIVALSMWPADVGRRTFWGILGFGLLAWVWSILSESVAGNLHSHLTTLNLGGQRVKTERPRSDYVPTVPAPPKVPAEWQPLLALPRPRDVYMTARAKLATVGGMAAVVASFGFAQYSLWKHHRAPWVHWIQQLDWISGLFLAAWIYYGIHAIRHELPARALLRDGEATIGVITQLKSSGHGTGTVSYRFWTQTGQRFEHRRSFISSGSEFAEGSLVPVFYLPEDPTRSAALCCAISRVRTAEDRMKQEMQRIHA